MERRNIQNFIGIDLGGARGKSTALCVLRITENQKALVHSVRMRKNDGIPWNDEALLSTLRSVSPADTVIAIGAPLTFPACIRCTLEICPGYKDCTDPATSWIRSKGQTMQKDAIRSDKDRIAGVSQKAGFRSPSPLMAAASHPLPPYTHRCTELLLHFQHQLLPKEQLAQGSWAINNRTSYLVRVLRGMGFTLHQNLLEVSPRATISALFGEESARCYKRDADPWTTRASIVSNLTNLAFSEQSRFGREDVLRNDNCFDALLCGYTAYLWATENWQMKKEGPFEADGWIWTPADAKEER